MSDPIKHTDQVFDWIWNLGGLPGVIPPFCVEVNLNDGASFYLHSIPETSSDTSSLVMRVWDFRSFSQEEMEDLKNNLAAVNSREALSDAENIHPKLDYADVRLHLKNIDYTIEWNDRLFPREERKKLMGFLARIESS